MIAESVGSTGDGGKGSGWDNYILIRDEQISGVAGGDFASGLWQTRRLNTLVVNLGGFASLASNQITLDAGIYRVEAHAPAFGVNTHKIKLRDITNNLDLVIGSQGRNSSTTDASGIVLLEGLINLSTETIVELQHRGQATRNGDGFGKAAILGVIEVYAVIEFWKEA